MNPKLQALLATVPQEYRAAVEQAYSLGWATRGSGLPERSNVEGPVKPLKITFGPSPKPAPAKTLQGRKGPKPAKPLPLVGMAALKSKFKEIEL